MGHLVHHKFLVFFLLLVCIACSGGSDKISKGPRPETPSFKRTFSDTTTATFLGFEGLCEPSVKVLVYRNNLLVDTITSTKNGVFKTKRIRLDKGSNRFYADAVDSKGRRSQKHSNSRHRGKESGRYPSEFVVERQ